MFSDVDIKQAMSCGEIVIKPYDQSMLRAASLDLKLGSKFIRYPASPSLVDTSRPLSNGRVFDASKVGYIDIPPNQFLLGCTLEYIEISNRVASRIEGRSSLGRMGLAVHATAGFIDPGFKGYLTLELKNNLARPLRLHVGQAVCQLCFYYLKTETTMPYSVIGRYNFQTYAQASKGTG